MVILVAFVGCDKKPVEKKSRWNYPDLHIATEDIVSMTLINFDSGDNKSPSPNDTRYAVTNKQDIAEFNTILQESLSTLQDDMFPKCVPWDVMIFVIELKNEELPLRIGLSKRIDGQPVYANNFRRDAKHFAISRGDELLNLLKKSGFPIECFEMPTQGYIPKSVEEVEASNRSNK